MKKKYIIAVLLLLTIIGLPVVYAKEKEDVFYASTNVKVKGEKDHTVFAAGADVTIDSVIDGMAFAAGNDISIKSTQDYIFAAGNYINLENAGSKETFLAGSDVEVKNSELRDVFIAAEKVTLESSKLRNAYIGGENVVIDSTIEGNLKVSASKIIVTENAIITGTLEYPKEANIDISKEATVSHTKTYSHQKSNKEVKTENVSSLFYSGISMIIIALVLLLINKTIFKKFEEFDKKPSSIITTMLIGTGILVLVPVVSFILLLTGIGMSLATLLMICYGLLFYLSIIPTSYYIGKWIAKDKINNYSILAISILVIYILRMIPVLGGLLCFASLIFGLGVYTKLIYESIKKENKKEEPTKDVTLKNKKEKQTKES